MKSLKLFTIYHYTDKNYRYGKIKDTLKYKIY